MEDFGQIRNLLREYRSLEGAGAFFRALGYRVMEPLPGSLDDMPPKVQSTISSIHQLVHVKSGEGGSPFRIFHVVLNSSAVRRSDIRYFLESFYRRNPQGENLFVFTPKDWFDDLVFISPRRLLDPRDPRGGRVRLWLRILQVRRERPYRTDCEVLSHIRVDGPQDPGRIWQLHEEAFRVERVTEQFFEDYSYVFKEIQQYLSETHRDNSPSFARDYTHELLNRIMFIYFIARKGWLLGPSGNPDRDFMRHFFEAYRETRARDAFHQDWLNVLFFEAFNGRWQNRAEYLKRFPEWLINSLARAPFLNGGLYSKRPGLDDCLRETIPDRFFELLFEERADGTTPGLFERYNFTVVESGRFDEEVAVDPEMLGMVYERLVNVTFESEGEDLRGTAGVFYTPRTEIDLMCRLSLVDWLGNHLGREHRDLLYSWVFAFSEEDREEADEQVTRKGLWKRLDELVRNVRVCDPACGSGSFLVGVMLVLDDLVRRCNRALGRSETPYERRKRIIQDQLYGVDVMEWAVRVAELRLWLQLVVETELEPEELHFRPLLPNLSFKVRSGDSLLQVVGNLDFSFFRRSELPITPHLKRKLNQFREKKLRFFQGEDHGLSEGELRREEQNLFLEILESKKMELQKRIDSRRQQIEQRCLWDSHPVPEEAGVEIELEAMEKERRQVEQALEVLQSSQNVPFVWDMAFVEVFENDDPGFDIVIGNPPYVRQERIRDYLGRFSREEYLDRLNESLRAIYPGFMGKTRTITRRADYYIYFYLHALSLLADQGSFCFITSNSWLDVDFGKDLQEFFLRFGHLKMVLDNRARRSFAQADVNTVIVLAGPPERKRPLSETAMKDRPVRFVAFRVPFEEALSPVVFSEIESEDRYEPLAGFRVLRRPEFRAILHDQWSLYREGLAEVEDGVDAGEEAPSWKRNRRRECAGPTFTAVDLRPYAGNKWGGKYLRAPDFVWRLIERGKMVPLGNLCSLEYGNKVGLVDFFILSKERIHQFGIEQCFLRKILTSTDEIETLRINPDAVQKFVFLCPLRLVELKRRGFKGAAKYIEWGSTQVTRKKGRHTIGDIRWPEVQSVRNNHPEWHCITLKEPGDFVVPQLIRERFFFAVNNGLHATNMFYCGHFVDRAGAEIGSALLNSSLVYLMLEIFGRHNVPGRFNIYGPDLKALPVPNPAAFDEANSQKLIGLFQVLSQRKIKKITEEIEESDRRAFDRVIFCALGLTESEQEEVYNLLSTLVRERLEKERSIRSE
jgi:hypothetical protein